MIETPRIASEATLDALEYPTLVRLLGALAHTDLGRERLGALLPAGSAAELALRRQAYEETARLGLDGPLVPFEEVALGPLVARLESARPPLEGSEILVLARALATAGAAARRIGAAGAAPRGIEAAGAAPRGIGAADPACPLLLSRLAGVADPAPLVARIGRVLDARGQVRDDASPRLKELRRQIQGARERLYTRLETVAAGHREALAEDTIPMRGGRLVLMLSAGARGRLAGLVHGRSGSGKSLYFEPLEVVEENNTLQSAVEEMEAERRRILAELLAALAAELPLVERLLDLLAELDHLEALGRFARLAGAQLPELGPAGRIRLVSARHPLLDPRLAALRAEVLGAAGHEGEIVPLDLELAAPRQVLVITGPNAGGKTVALKTLGLLALAAQAGLPIPAAAGSELPWLLSVVATVGDEQDLLAERSTFSGRLQRLAEAWRAAGPDALALVDELGSGTDPEEGAALSRALVEELAARGGLALVTTHLAALAAAALELPGAGCAAMEFEPESGRPTFRLRPGSPGGSEALALARRLGLPGDWIARAEALLGPGHRDLRRLMAELEATRSELAAEAERARRGAESAALEEARLERERSALEAERRGVGAKLRGELAAFREKVERQLVGELGRLREEFAAGRRESAARAAAARLLAEAPDLVAEETEPTDGPLEVGAPVRHRRLGWTGRLERLDGERALVLVRGKKLAAQAGDLAPAAAPVSAQPVRSEAAEREAAAAELQLIGLRVEEAIELLDGWLDRALADGREQVRVVHGHGTGRLREAVRQHLRRHPAVAAHRPGAANEGGNGATVVTLGFGSSGERRG